MSQRFIRCPHCGMPHNLTDVVCPATGRPVRQRKSGSGKSDAAHAAPSPPPPKPLQAPLHPSSEVADPTLVGRVIGDKYGVHALIGEGGMGTVYEAEHLTIGRRVAIKVLNRSHLGRRDAVARFHQEARAAGSIGHPNICEIYDVGRLDDGSPYLVMERLHGKTLADRINIEGALGFEDVIAVMTQVLSALWAAHDKNIIHRDVKPDNIFLSERVGCAPVVKILDFGISKSANDQGNLSLTRTGMVMGTPFYMAPEQARGDVIDHRVDIYACGVILYEALTGRRPFIASNYNALVVQVLAKQPRDPRELRPAIPQGFVPLIFKALSKKRDDRFADARVFLEALSKLQDELRGVPTAAEIAMLAQEVRRSTRPPPPMIHFEPPPLSESMDIPVVFSETQTGAQVALNAGDLIQVDQDLSEPTSADERDVEFSDPAPAVGRLNFGVRRSSPDLTEEVNDTIVDPSGSMLGELWAQLRGGQAAQATDATTKNASLGEQEAAGLLRDLDEPSVDIDDPTPSVAMHVLRTKRDLGRYAMLQDDGDDEDGETARMGHRAKAPRQPSEPVRPAVPRPSTVPRPSAPPSSRKGGSGLDQLLARQRAVPGVAALTPRRPEPPRAAPAVPKPTAPRPSTMPRAPTSSDPDDDTDTSLFVASSDRQRPAEDDIEVPVNTTERAPARNTDSNPMIQRAPRPPNTPKFE